MGIIASNTFTLAVVKDGSSSYMFTRYSSIEEPHTDMYEVPNDDTVYIGTYISSENIPSTNPSDYVWVRYRSDDPLFVQIIADNGTSFSNDGQEVSLTAIAKKGKDEVVGTYKWYKENSIIPNITSANYTFLCTGLSIYTTIKCEVTYNGEVSEDSITIENNMCILYGSTDPYENDSVIYIGSIWIDTSSGPNTYKKYDGTQWVQITLEEYYKHVGYGTGKTTEFFSTKIKETADEISSVANKVSINETSIKENYSELKQTADNISSEVTSMKTDISDNKSEIETAKSQITQNTDSITALTKTVNTNEEDIETKFSSLELTTDTISTEVSSVKKDLINLERRNYVRNSAFLYGSTAWTLQSNVSLDTEKTFNGHPSAKSEQTSNTSNKWYGVISRYLPDYEGLIVKAGEVWTYSCWYYIEDISTLDSTVSLTLKGYKDGATSDSSIGSISINASNAIVGAWTKLEKTIYPTVDYSRCCLRAFVTLNGTVWFTDFKLEKNSQSTDWTPAPEDTEIAIEETNSKITQNSDSITSLVERITNAENNITDNYTKVEQTATQISWLIKSGESSSNMVLTDDALNIIAENIDLTGKVTFSSLDTSTQDKITNVQDTITSWSDGTATTTTIDGRVVTTGYIKDVLYNGTDGDVSNTEGSIINLTTGNFSFAGGKIKYDGTNLSIVLNDFSNLTDSEGGNLQERFDVVSERIEEQSASIITSTEEILLTALESYVTTTEYGSFKENTESELSLLSDQLSLKFTETIEQIDSINSNLQDQLNTINKYFTFNTDGLTIGQEDNPYKMNLDNDKLSFLVEEDEVMWIDAETREVFTPSLTLTQQLNLFGFRAELDSSSNVNWDHIG